MPDDFAPGAVEIPNRYVGPMALRYAFRRAAPTLATTLPKIATLTDTFDIQDTSKWAYPSGVAATGGELVFTPAVSTQTLIASVASFDATDSAIYIETTGFGTDAFGFGLQNATDTSDFIEFYRQADNVFVFDEAVNGVTDTTTITYNATDHKWWRITNTSGNWLWETSPDGATWTTRRTKAQNIGFDITNVEAYVYVDSGNPASTTKFDNLNNPLLDTGLPPSPLRIPNRNVGPMALRYLYRYLLPSFDTDNFSGSSVDTTITVGLTADGVVGATTGASTAITVGLTADGVIGATTSSTSTALTVGLTADGLRAEDFAPTPFLIPNRNVGPMALRFLYRQPQSPAAAIVVSGDFTGTSTSTITVGLTADGVVGTVSGASTAITVTATAAGAVDTSSGATTAITVGLTAAGSVGAVGQAATTITVGLTAAGMVGAVGDAATPIVVGLTADGQAVSYDSYPPLRIANRFVGPMALRNLWRWAQPGIPEPPPPGDLTGTASTTITVGLTAAGTVGVVGQASSTITVGLTAAGIVGAIGQTTQTVTVGLTAAGSVGTVSQSVSTVVTVGLTAAGAVGTAASSTATIVTIGLTAAGTVTVTGVGAASLATTVTLTAAGRVEIIVDPDRTYAIKPESRTCIIRVDSRTAVIKPESRTVTIKPESRIAVIKPESRTVVLRR